MLKINKVQWKYVVLLGMVLLSVSLRFYALDSRSLWRDEVDSVFKSFDFESGGYEFERRGLPESLTFPLKTTFEDGTKAPLYFVFLGCWINMFGPGSWGIRFFSVIFGLASIVVFFLFTSEQFGEKLSILATFLLAVSPVHVLYSQEVRGYSLLLLCSVISTWLYLKLLKGGASRSTHLCYFFSLLLLVYVHYYGILYVAAQGLIVLFLFIKENFNRRYLSLMLSQFLTFLAFLPWVTFALIKYSGVVSGKSVAPYPTFNFALRGLWILFSFFFGESMSPWSIVVVLGMLVAVALFAKFILVFNEASRDVKIIFFLTVISVVLSMALKPTLPKHAIFALPGFLILVAFTTLKFRSAFSKGVVFAVLMMIWGVSICNYYGLKEMHNSNRMEPWKEISSAISGSYREGDRIYVNNRYVAFQELQYYLNVLAKRGVEVSFVKDGIEGDRGILVLHIQDEEYKEEVFRAFDDAGYRVKLEKPYVPYGETVASKLPRRHHRIDQARVEVYLYGHN
jgi:4-amino-4-deoxy-L-arabinose transferase-like glycosyltransferase